MSTVAGVTRFPHSKGYMLIRVIGNPRGAGNNWYIKEHIVIAETAMGRPLPPKAVVHHVNGNKADNRNDNLVICENEGYHRLIHKRMRVLAFGGSPDTDKVCGTCQTVKPLLDFPRWANGPDGRGPGCLACLRRYNRTHPKRKKAFNA